MKKLFLFLIVIASIMSCSTNNNNGTVTVIPLAPTNLIGSVISTSQINLSWTDNATNEDGYKIERKTANGNYSVIGSMGANLTNYNDLGLTPNTSYTYRVYAYNSAGNSLQYSNEVTVTTQDTIPSWLTNGLVGYWPFNDNANDESGNGNEGIVNGATLTTDRFGDSSKAFEFGSGKNISVPMSVQLFMLPIRTFSCWFYSNGIQNGGRIYETTFMNGGIALYNGNLLDTWYAYSQHCCDITGMNSGNNNQWHHLVSYANDNTGLTEVYLDGVKIASQFGNASGINGCNINTNWNWQNEFLRFGLGASGESFNGSIDDIRIYNRALSASEVAYLASH